MESTEKKSTTHFEMHTFCTFLILACLAAFISTWLHMTVCYDDMQERNPVLRNTANTVQKFQYKRI